MIERWHRQSILAQALDLTAIVLLIVPIVRYYAAAWLLVSIVMVALNKLKLPKQKRAVKGNVCASCGQKKWTPPGEIKMVCQNRKCQDYGR